MYVVDQGLSKKRACWEKNMKINQTKNYPEQQKRRELFGEGKDRENMGSCQLPV